MNQKIKNAWEWIKDHKVVVIELGVCAVAAIIGGIVLHNEIKHVNLVKYIKDSTPDFKPPENLNISDIGVGEIDGVFRYNDGIVELWLDKIPLTDMGKLGEAIADKIPDIPANPNAWALLSIKPGEETVG